MAQDIFVVMLLAAALFGVWIFNQISQKKRKAYIQIMLKEEWGIGHAKEYTYEEFERISHYYQNRQQYGNIEGSVIDDITWNDLEMDALFLQMNHTYSNIGEEYLYDLLRRPKTDKESLKERERLITFFTEHEEERRVIQTKCYEIGKTVKVAVSDYIYRLTKIERKGNQKHYIAIAGLFAAVGLAFFNVTVGVVAFIVMMYYNIQSYYKEKKEIEAYITTFSYIMRLLSVSDRFEQVNIPELDTYIRRISEANKAFKKFRKGSVLLVSGQSMGGSPIDSLLDYVRMLFHVDLIKFNSMLGELQKHIDAVETILEQIGFLDSMAAVASYRCSVPYYAVPELEHAEQVFFEAEDLYHPLIENAVPNSLTEKKGVLVTGSNASGKSTFLKSAAICAVLAQTIHTCPARRYKSCYFQIYSSMALKDNLQGNESYYIVEIKSLKRILNHVGEDTPILCFVDEVLRGTNTVERIAASSQILKSLARKDVMCFAATHDIELTHLLKEMYHNYHFQEEVMEDDILFHYKLYEGRAVSRNAIRLLGIIGYDQGIIEEAEKTAERFVESGVWSL